MSEDHVCRQVNENQCQICMPIGGAIAFKGIEQAMVIVHGSQGCSTYMRLAMVEHYNEPVDIASSSLNEKQTIYGGEANLRKALDNVIRVYNPKMIGIVTTCLTETMGEDVKRMAITYLRDRNLSDVAIIPIQTPSYNGSQYEGFWTAIREVIMHYARRCDDHAGINIILPQVSPADTREIKRLLELMEINYTLIPDLSLTLDRPYGRQYQKIPPGGTKHEDISRMSGAKATIQFGSCCPDELSPGRYLEKEFGVPLYNLPLPTGLASTDRFIETLISITGKKVPDLITLERGWLCDAMADSHKYNAEITPVIYGDPEFVYAITGLCLENGAYPGVIAIGTTSEKLKENIGLATEMADRKPLILEKADFTEISAASRNSGVNLAIGHSGGKYLTEHMEIPVVRVGFPIHDRLGGQRILTSGYVGSLNLLDRITNTYLEKKYQNYRKLLKDEFYCNGGI